MDYKTHHQSQNSLSRTADTVLRPGLIVKPLSSQIRRLSLRRWFQVLPVVLLASALPALAQVFTITEEPGENGFQLTFAPGTSPVTIGSVSTIGGFLNADVSSIYGSGAHETVLSSPAFEIYNPLKGPNSAVSVAWSDEPNPSDGINVIVAYGIAGAVAFMEFYSDVKVSITDFEALNPLRSNFDSRPIHFTGHDTGLITWDPFETPEAPSGQKVMFYDNAASTPDAASSLSLSLMATAALFGAGRFKLIPLAHRCDGADAPPNSARKNL